MISISPCTARSNWTAHLSNPLSFGRCRRDVGVGVGRAIRLLCLVEVDVENVCEFELGVMHCIHGDKVYELFELPANEETLAEFCVAPLIEWFGVSEWHVIFFVSAISSDESSNFLSN